MTVAELRKLLDGLPDDMPVLATDLERWELRPAAVEVGNFRSIPGAPPEGVRCLSIYAVDD